MRNKNLDSLSIIDKKLLKTLLIHHNNISSHEISEKLGLPQSTIDRRREFLEKHYLQSSHAENLKALGFRHVNLQLYSGGGNTVAIAKKIKGNKAVDGDKNIRERDDFEPQTNVIIGDNLELFPLLEQVKAMGNLKEGICSEIVDMNKKRSIPIGMIVANMKNKDHLAVSYSTAIELEEMISNFFSSGLRQNMVNLWIVKKQEAEQWKAILNKKGINVDSMIDSEELIIVTHEEIYSDAYFGSSFSPILEKLDSLKKIIQEKQKGGINAIDTVSGNLFLQKRFSDCINIEKNWHKIINSFEIPLILLCPYESTISRGRSELIESHNRGVINATLDKLFEINILA